MTGATAGTGSSVGTGPTVGAGPTVDTGPTVTTGTRTEPCRAATAGWPDAPVIYEVDTWPWLRDLSEQAGRPLTLADVPDGAWDEMVPPGADAVWLMGVWERSPAGYDLALRNEELMAGFRAALPDLVPQDVAGSPYCVRRYVVDDRLGGPAGLAAARQQLRRRSALLVLDYVPNHVAPDHPWVQDHPERFVRGSAEDRAQAPDAWFDLNGEVLAHGRDPYFPPWPDVVQLNAFARQTRHATAEVLTDIGGQCDGVRCDMAMLMINDIFARTWGAWAGERPEDEFWPGVLAAVRARHPQLRFIAEAYWDLEWELQQQGFDYCYDKRLYDRLVHEDAASVRAHLLADLAYQQRLVRFIENHDEPRAATALAGARERAAAVTVATVPGATLWHDGQFEGRRRQLPVFLGRRPAEPVDGELRAFYDRLLTVVAEHRMREGSWCLLDCHGWPDNPTNRNLVAWAWSGSEAGQVIVVNLSDAPAQARIPLPWQQLADGVRRVEEALHQLGFERDGQELVSPGLFVDLPAWGFHVFTLNLPPTPTPTPSS